jgi:hypothetical protein
MRSAAQVQQSMPEPDGGTHNANQPKASERQHQHERQWEARKADREWGHD